MTTPNWHANHDSVKKKMVRHVHVHRHQVDGREEIHSHEHEHDDEDDDHHDDHDEDAFMHVDPRHAPFHRHAHSHNAFAELAPLRLSVIANSGQRKETVSAASDRETGAVVVLSSSPSPTDAARTADTSAAPASSTLSNRQRCLRFAAARIIVRLVMLGLLIYLSRFIPWRRLLSAYLSFLQSLDPWPISAVLFFGACALPFCAFTPGSYAPTVIAGATFGIAIGASLSYVVMNLAALLNFFTVRRCCGRLPWVIKRVGTFRYLDPLLARRPVRTIALLRLPYLGSGILNYVFSLTPVKLSVRDVVLGNAAGFSLGSVLFAVLGTQARSIGAMLLDGQADAVSIVTVVLVIAAVVITVIGLLWTVRRETAGAAAAIAAGEPVPVDSPAHDATAMGSTSGVEESGIPMKVIPVAEAAVVTSPLEAEHGLRDGDARSSHKEDS